MSAAAGPLTFRPCPPGGLRTGGSSQRRLLIVADSSLSGLGQSGPPCWRLLADQLNADVLAIAVSGLSLAEVMENHKAEITAFRPELAVVDSGGTEALVVPGARVQALIERYAPQSWHGVAGLETRARYSTQLRRRIKQRLESEVKVAVKRVLTKMTDRRPRIQLADFCEQFADLLVMLEGTGTKTLVLGMPSMPKRLFPGSEYTMRQIDGVLQLGRGFDLAHRLLQSPSPSAAGALPG